MKQIIHDFDEYDRRFNKEPLEQTVGKRLRQKDLTVSVAESCTGGLVSSMLTDVSGSSEYIKLNFVTYSNEAKSEILGVDSKILEKYGAVSKETAVQMAFGTVKRAKCDIGLAITGIAGPTGGTDEKPVGLVYIALCDNVNSEVTELRLKPSYSRKEIKMLSSINALNLLLEFISTKV